MRKRIHIYYDIRELYKKISDFYEITSIFSFLLYCFFLFRHKLQFGRKFNNILAFVGSQSQYVIKLKSCFGWASVYIIGHQL